MKERTYVVLMQAVVDTKVGDDAYVVLGFYESSTAARAKRQARQLYELEGDAVLVAVAGRYWR